MFETAGKIGESIFKSNCLCRIYFVYTEVLGKQEILFDFFSTSCSKIPNVDFFLCEIEINCLFF